MKTSPITIKPYFLVIHKGSGQSAVYNRKYEKEFEGASCNLINHAIENHTRVQDGFKLTYPEQQPSWMTPKIKEDCICYHLYDDNSTTRKVKENISRSPLE